jgi:YGGT family
MPEIIRVEYQEDPLKGSIQEVQTMTLQPGYIEQTLTPFSLQEVQIETQPTQRRYRLVRISQIVYLVAGIIEALIGIRFVLKLIAANPQAGFARFIYGITTLFLIPFTDLTSNPSIAGVVLEISSLIAMLIYALLAWAIVRIAWTLFSKPPIAPLV